jgi:MOSC domain-containing protein YiiM
MGQSLRNPGVIKKLFIKAKQGNPMHNVPELDAVANKGLKGDQAFGRKSRQVLLVDLSQLDKLGLNPGDLRENITVDGLPLDSLPLGTKLLAGEVVLRIVENCDPCSKLETIRPGLMLASKGKRGMLAVIEKGGLLSEGSPITCLEVEATREAGS